MKRREKITLIDSGQAARQSEIKETNLNIEGGDMENRKCLVLVDGKECGLDLILIEQDIDSETQVYECARGHRQSVLLGRIEKRKCSTLVNDKACNLALSVTGRDLDAATEIYECPLGHRTYVPLERNVIDNSF